MKIFLRLVILPLLIYIGACSKTKHVTIDLEVYYHIFDGVTKIIPGNRRVLLRIDSTLCAGAGFGYGDSLTVTFQEKQGKLLPKSISPNGSQLLSKDEYFLNGIYEGMIQGAGECLIGFEIIATHSEYLATEMQPDVTKLVSLNFLANKAELEIDLIEVIGQIDKRPVTRK